MKTQLILNQLILDNLPKFVVFEGGEGVGKTTAIHGVCQFLDDKNIHYVRTREPGGSDVGEQLRKIFLNPDSALNADSELLMIFSARIDHLNKIILPALAKGHWVLCDRFVDSTVAYQAFGRWSDDANTLNAMLENIHLLSHKFISKMPDVRFWLDLDPKIGRERAKSRGVLDRLEQEPPEFYERVYRGFDYQYRHANDGTMVRIDANGTTDEVLSRIIGR